MSQKNKNFGLEKKNLKLLLDLLGPLSACCEVWVFGSRARGDYKKFSDIDLLVVGNPTASVLRGVKASLEESRLPYKIDLVLDLEISEVYRDSVYKEKIRIL